ncbi:MAG: 3-deoxy-D-manno-octulosonic acid transferase [Deltaproteobacteria bacterium]|nr:3-deoxy-D-manno-octulosonic acid transferase [Deltaproteobacteria bacterium]PWB65414.1 MAG: 3-deoxy-D-manno-octulosonic acid transferase [Deltaproteobacteria bacterium]
MRAFLPRTGAHLLYNLALGSALVLAAPAWGPWVLASRKRRKNFFDRLGMRMDRVPPPSGKERIWIHAVSVGETLSAAPLVRLLRRRLPETEILFSTVTLTGRETADKVLGEETDARFYFPFDLPSISRKFIDRLRPDVVVILETEIWPNFLAECAGRKIPAVLLNGRVSERSLGGYARLRFLFSRALCCFTAIAAQTEEDARRFLSIGAPPGSVAVTGNMKFDVALPAQDLSPLYSLLMKEKERGTAWFVAGSTHEGEEEAVLRAFAKARGRNGSIKLVLAPRHPERFAAVGELCVRAGWETVRKTGVDPGRGDPLPPVVLLDTVGELLSAYAAADLAFVGGSLVPKGGHNILEPALFGVPTLVGPHMENFREISEIFRDAQAIAQVADGAGLASLAESWARDPSVVAGTGRRARELLAAFRGATGRNAGIVERELSRRRRERE